MIDNPKSHKLFLYFPTTADATFPSYDVNVGPAQPSTSPHETRQSRRPINEITQVAADDYCEFNVQVLPTTANPGTMASPSPRRSTAAVAVTA